MPYDSIEAERPSSEAGFLRSLVAASLLDARAAERAAAGVISSGQPLDVVLSELGLVGDAPLAAAQARYLGLDVTGPAALPDAALPLDGVDPAFLKAARLLPLAESGDGLTVASAWPLRQEPLRALAYFLDRRIDLKVISRADFEAAFQRLYCHAETGTDAVASQGATSEGDLERLKDLARDAPTIRLLNQLVTDAVERGASDIHLEPGEDGLRVRLRLDGVLQVVATLPGTATAGVLTRTKILAGLNIAERRLPQDGRFRTTVRGRDIDLRVATAPTFHGEGVVLRILDRGSVPLRLSGLGFSPNEERTLRDLLAAPNGVVLVTGPTGSGKTTTLYAALAEINRDQAKIFTVEDPVEHQVPGISQIQVKPAIGLDFPAALRSILRQDPDVVMIGEIRDGETARIAIQAALTGHLVLSTLHTNGTAASVTRLVDMGVERFLAASALRGIVAQRLVRKVCPRCCRHEPIDAAFLPQSAARPGGRVPVAVGCLDCGGTGYAGRTTIAEILPVGSAVRALIVAGATEAAIEAEARRQGHVPLREAAIHKALAGETTLAEALRATHGEDGAG